MHLIDISRPLHPQTAVWPGDEPYARRWTARMEQGELANVGAVTLSTHTGAHADAPLHVAEEGRAVEALPLAAFLGPVHLLDAHEADVLRPEDAAGVDFERTPRVLFKARRRPDDETVWTGAFAAFSVALIEWLAARGVVLVGTDAPSVDPLESMSLAAHHALARCGIVHLENLDLRAAPPGAYDLVALPLPLVGMDASPVRAVLVAR